MTADSAISRLYDLRPAPSPVAEESPHEGPHKPLPFPAITHNDHPTNGPCRAAALRRRRITLCNHHPWAMNRNLITPAPDHHWHACHALWKLHTSNLKLLPDLAGKSVLVPKDPAFHPDRNALEWRCARLTA